MIRVIRNPDGLYFKRGGEWTRHFPEAEKFTDIRAVIATWKQFRLEDVYLVIVMNDQPSRQWDVVLPLSD
jgi:hypothetical protein